MQVGSRSSSKSVTAEFRTAQRKFEDEVEKNTDSKDGKVRATIQEGDFISKTAETLTFRPIDDPGFDDAFNELKRRDPEHGIAPDTTSSQIALLTVIGLMRNKGLEVANLKLSEAKAQRKHREEKKHRAIDQ
jgi:hypothetical protein